MFFDLNIPVPVVSSNAPTQSKKGKGKQQQSQVVTTVTFSPGQISALEARLDLLVHCQCTYFGEFHLF